MKIADYFIICLFILSPVISYSKINIKKAQLENGMSIYVIENHLSPIVSHMVLYNVGGANDPQGQSGLAHYLEHLMFRGTKEVKDISSLIEKNGGIFNASTSSYYTNYFETVPKDKLELMMQLEADRMRNLHITDDAIIAERKIVMEERKMRIDNDFSAQLQEEMLSAFYRNSHDWQIAGWPHEIITFNKEKAYGMYENFYYPNNAVLLVSGDTTMNQVLDLANKYYGIIPKSNNIPKQQLRQEPEHKSNMVITLNSSSTKTREFNIFFQAPNISNNDALPILIASVALGKSKLSHLHKLFVKKEITADIDVHYNPFTRGENILAISGIPFTDPLKVSHKVIEAIDEISDRGISDKDLQRAKNMLKADLIYQTEEASGQANFYSNLIMSDTNYNTIQYLEEEIEKISLEQVNSALKNTLYQTSTIIGYLSPQETGNEK